MGVGLTCDAGRAALPCMREASGSAKRSCFCADGGAVGSAGRSVAVTGKALPLCKLPTPSSFISVSVMFERSVEGFLCGGDTTEDAESPLGDAGLWWLAGTDGSVSGCSCAGAPRFDRARDAFSR